MKTTRTRRFARLAAAVGVLSSVMFAGSAKALGDVDPHGFDDLRKTIAKMPALTDRNKDGTVSRKEYLDMQGRMFDMASKKGTMTMEEFKAFMAEFKTFGQ